MTLCVYAITGGASRLSARGVAGERLQFFRESSLAAVVGRLENGPRASPENLRRYDRTVQRLGETVSALLPARFGTCFEDPEELRFVLRSRRASLQRALAHVRNRVQMTVRIIDSGSPPGPLRGTRPTTAEYRGRDAAEGGPAGAPRGSGTSYLRARAAAAARANEVAGFDVVRAAVARWLRDERVERRGPIVTVYHLVPRSAGDAYQRAVNRAAAAAGIRLVVSGPWPPYAFAATL